MIVERIYTCAGAGQPQVERAAVTVVAGMGIEGDRYFGRHEEPGQNLTLVEVEELEAFLTEHGQAADPAITRRNILTRGVRLNTLVGITFQVGRVHVRGVEWCDPCLEFGARIATPNLSAAQVVKRWLHRGGLRVDVLTSGCITRGAAITVGATAVDTAVSDASSMHEPARPVLPVQVP